MVPSVCVTGASGFVGQSVLKELLARSYRVHALVHRRPLDGYDERVRSFSGSIHDAAALGQAMEGCVAVLHLVGIIRENADIGITFERVHVEGTRSVVNAAVAAKVRRFVHLSALGARPGAGSRYHRTKFEAERLVRESGLDWTILRPSLIHGPGGDFMQQEARWARRRATPFLFMPYFGGGAMGFGPSGRVQPIYVGDVARALVDAMENPQHAGEVHLLGGPDRYSWPELHRACSTAIKGSPTPAWPVPAWYGRLLARLLPALLPFNTDMVEMSQEDNTCDLTKFKSRFGWDPSPLPDKLKEYAAKL